MRVSCIVTPCQGAEALKQSPSMKQAPKEAGEGQRGTHMGYINAVVPVSNHVIHWSAHLGASLTRIRDKGVLNNINVLIRSICAL